MEKLTLKGKKFIIRNFCEDDIYKPNKFVTYINNLINDSSAMIPLKIKMTLEEEKEWLIDMLSMVKLSRIVVLIVELNDQIVGGAEISFNSKYREECVAEFSISIIKDYRGYGLGSYLLPKIINMAKENLKPKPTIIKLSVFSNNKHAITLYKKYGFKMILRIPNRFKFNGRLTDEILMLKSIKRGGGKNDCSI